MSRRQAHFNPRARVGRDIGRPAPRGSRSNFNPRARVGRDPRSSSRFLPQPNFNPRARVGRDGRGSDFRRNPRISIHAPAWGATAQRRAYPSWCRISIHAPAWGATGPHLCVSRACGISIHAPAWGATLFSYFQGLSSKISIHAPAWGATYRRTSRTLDGLNFNPRARVGRDAGKERSTMAQIEFQSTRPRGARRAGRSS